MGIFDRIADTLDELVSGGQDGEGRQDDEETIRLAKALAARGDVEEAMARLSALVSSAPRGAAALEVRGELRAERADWEGAVEDFGRAVMVDPSRVAAWLGLGEALSTLGRWEPARDAFRRASTLAGLAEEDVPRVLFGLGRVYGELGQHDKAVRELRKSIERSRPGEEDARALAALGHALLASGERDGADWLARAGRQHGGEVRWLVEAAMAKARHASGGAAASRTPPPPPPESDGAAPGAEARQAEPSREGSDLADLAADPALLLLREAVTRAPADAAVRAALAWRLAELGADQAAHGEAAAAAALESGRSEGWAILGELQFRDGHFEAALGSARRQHELGGVVPFARWLALALGAREVQHVGEALAHGEPTAPGYQAAVAFHAGRADAACLLELARFAPDEASRRFVLAFLAPPPPPASPPPPPPPASPSPSPSPSPLPSPLPSPSPSPCASLPSVFSLLRWARDFAADPARASFLPSSSLLPVVPLARAVEAFDRPLLLAVMGEFNAGKSSFVNALAGEAVARVGVTPTTATINILRYGPAGSGLVRFQDGTVRELRPDQVTAYLTALGDDEAGRIRTIEVYAAAETLRHIEIVDTPGLNALRAEHERVAREFVTEADAVVWVFAVGQAAKASERAALELLHAAGKQVLGVVNKIDEADPADVRSVLAHVSHELGALLVRTLPFSARYANRARRAGTTVDAETLAVSGLPAVQSALEELFFARARQLKEATATTALQRFVGEVAAIVGRLEADETERLQQLWREEDRLHALETALRSALDAERIALRARIDRAIRSTAADVRELIRPRVWPFGEHRLEGANETTLTDLLDDAVRDAADATLAALRAVVEEHALGLPAPTCLAVTAALGGATESFRSYARGYLEGAAAIFLRIDLPRLRLDSPALASALGAHAPNPDQAFIHALDQKLSVVFREAHRTLVASRAVTELRRLAIDEWFSRPLTALRQLTTALTPPSAPAAGYSHDDAGLAPPTPH